MKYGRGYLPIVMLAAILAGGASLAWAQGAGGTIQGRILDPSHSAVPGAVITARDMATGLVTATRSATDEGYIFNHPIFASPSYNILSQSFGQVTSTTVGPRNVQLRASISW